MNICDCINSLKSNLKLTDFKNEVVNSEKRVDIENSLSFFLLDYVGGFVDEAPFDKKFDIHTKFLKVQLTNVNTSLQFDQIELYNNKKNITEAGKVTHSSKYSKFKQRKNKTETNGNITGDIGFHTEMEDSPWWQIEFEKKTKVNRIRLFNRQDWWWARLRRFEILVSNDGAKWNTIYQNSHLEQAFTKLEFILDKLSTINKFIADKSKSAEKYYYSSNNINFLTIDFLDYFQYLISNRLYEKKQLSLLKDKYNALLNVLKDELANYLPDTIEIGGKLNGKPLTVHHKEKARYIRLQLGEKGILSFDKIEVFNLNNELISKGKKIKYSTINKNVIAEPQNVLDSSPTGMPQFLSQLEESPFLLIDLGEIKEVEKIVVYNRCDSQAWKLNALSIFAGTRQNNLTKIHANNEDLIFVKDTYNFLFPYFIKDVSFLADMALAKVRLRKNLKQAWRLLALGIRIDKAKAIEIFEKIDLATKFDEFSPKLFASNHGISQKISDDRIGVIVSSMKEIIDFFKDEFDIEVCLAYGTLLGATRDKKIIPHDDDIDLVYVSKQSTKNKVFEERNEIIKKLIDNGFKVRKSSGNFHVRKGKGFIIDLFPSWVSDNNWFVYPFVKGEIPFNQISPNTELEFEGHLFPVPKNYKKVLEVIYGSTWHISDPLFRHNWDKHGSFFKFLSTYEKFVG